MGEERKENVPYMLPPIPGNRGLPPEVAAVADSHQGNGGKEAIDSYLEDWCKEGTDGQLDD